MKVCPVCQREYPAGAVQCTEDGVPLVAMVTDVNQRSEELVGKIVEGRYKIERIIGKGGMGTVYACRHVVVGKVAAMKVLKAGVERSDGVLQRFVREAQTANLLRSRHIVEVSDFGQLPNGAFFVVMELLEGQDLARAMRSGLGRAQMVHVFTQVAETLQLAHDKGIVHRDLKPDNVFLVNDSGDPLFVKLLDFGIAKILHGDGNSGLTETGVILGTPYYMSPEQARAEAIDHRSDIYALGVMMYRAFTGRLPFMADSTMGVLTRHITETPQPPSQIGNVDQVTERMILRCLAKKPEYRYQSMREVAEALKHVPLEPVPAMREASTVYEGPLPAAQQTAMRASSGAHPQLTSSAPSGAYAQAPQMPSGPHTPVPGATGPHPSGPHPQMPSGPHPQMPSGPHPQMPSGPYAQMPSGPHPQMPSGAFAAAPGGYDPRISSGPAVGHPGMPAMGGVAPGGAPTGTMTALHVHGAPGQGIPVAPEPTTRGVAATSYPTPVRGSSAALLAIGGLGMAAIGAVAAFFLLYRPATSTPAGPGAVPSTAVTVAPTPTAAPTSSASAAATSAPTASASASAEPAAASTQTAGAKPHAGGGPRPVPVPAPTATAAAAAPKHPRDIRSPFD